MLALSQIAGDSLYPDRFTVAKNQARTYFQPNTPSMLRDDVDLVNRRYFLARLMSDHFAREVQMLGRDYVGDIHRCCFFTRIACDPFTGAIERGEVALKVVRVDDVVSVFEELSIAFFAFPNGGFSSASVSDVGSHTDDTQHVVAFVRQR